MIMGSSKRVALVTAISPRAFVDIVFVGAEVLRLIRRVATLYEGRPGALGFLRLARATMTHLAVTGGMAAGDSMIQQILGTGIAARLSARLGEGVVNGLLTARVGIAAVEVCRPLPFVVGTPSPPRRRHGRASLVREGRRSERHVVHRVRAGAGCTAGVALAARDGRGHWWRCWRSPCFGITRLTFDEDLRAIFASSAPAYAAYVTATDEFADPENEIAGAGRGRRHRRRRTTSGGSRTCSSSCSSSTASARSIRCSRSAIRRRRMATRR